MALTFDHSTSLIGVPALDAQPLLIQDLINQIRDEEASERGIVHDQIADASGKANLGGGVYTGITVELLGTWKLSFATGSYQALVDGGNLAEGLDRIANTGSPQVVLRSSAAATLVLGSGGSAPSAATVAAAVLAAAAVTPIDANVKEVNDVAVTGTGVPPTYDVTIPTVLDPGDPWRPA